MVRTILINSSNLVNRNQYNKFSYTFPSCYNARQGAQIAVASLSMYNSTYNITSSYQNNTITVTFNNGQPQPLTFHWTIPDGYYSVEDLNNWLQSQMILHNLYATTANGAQNVYFLEFKTNATRYSCQINSYPQTNANGLVLPDNSQLVLSEPQFAYCPQITIGQNLGTYFGLPAGRYPTSTNAIIPQNFVSADYALSPSVSVVDSYIIGCSMITNNLSNPNNFLYQIPLTAGLGEMIQIQPLLVWNEITPGQHFTVDITLYDQSGNLLQNKDPSFCLTLAIMDAPDPMTSGQKIF